jgi:hypothetical protein
MTRSNRVPGAARLAIVAAGALAMAVLPATGALAKAVTPNQEEGCTQLNFVTAVKETANSILASAQLTSTCEEEGVKPDQPNGEPVSDEPVYFSAGPDFLCFGYTNEDGWVHCLDVQARNVIQSLNKVASAYFPGDEEADLTPAFGLGPVIRFS